MEHRARAASVTSQSVKSPRVLTAPVAAVAIAAAINLAVGLMTAFDDAVRWI